MDLFNEHPNCSSEEIIFEKEKLTKQREELLFQSASNNYNRDGRLVEFEKKADAITKDSSEFYKK